MHRHRRDDGIALTRRPEPLDGEPAAGGSGLHQPVRRDRRCAASRRVFGIANRGIAPGRGDPPTWLGRAHPL